MKQELAVDALGQLAQRFALPATARRRLGALVDLVASDPAAPTTVTEPLGIVRDHLADSLVALELPAVREAEVVADVGSGAGFPGLPLAVALPRVHVSLVESNGRKCAFLGRAAAVCGLDNATVVYARAEQWRAGRASCDLVVVRAVAALSVVAEYAAPLLRIGGTLVAWRGQRDPEDEARAARAAAILGLLPSEPVHVAPYPGARNRHLHPMVKAQPTPPAYPRRAGMALKRPLG